MFIKTVFKTTFGLSNVLKITFSALNHVNNIRGFTSNMWFVQYYKKYIDYINKGFVVLS